MPGKPQTWREIIDLWPYKAQMARSLQIDRRNIDNWYRANRVPVKHWRTILRAMQRFGYRLTADDLLDVNENSGQMDPPNELRRAISG